LARSFQNRPHADGTTRQFHERFLDRKGGQAGNPLPEIQLNGQRTSLVGVCPTCVPSEPWHDW
jgi:hypothetical protein